LALAEDALALPGGIMRSVVIRLLWYRDIESARPLALSSFSRPALTGRIAVKWLALRDDHPDPWTEGMVRYGPVKSRPSTLAESFIRDLLQVTGGGKLHRSSTRATTR
jgi:hypothetical protein